MRFSGDVLGGEKPYTEKRLEVLLHQRLQGFFDVHDGLRNIVALAHALGVKPMKLMEPIS